MTFGQKFINGIALLYMDVPQTMMLLISMLLLYLAIKKKYEPLLLLPIGFGMFLANLPMPEVLGLPGLSAHSEGGLLYYLYASMRIGRGRAGIQHLYYSLVYRFGFVRRE